MALGSAIYKLTFDSNAGSVLKPTRREFALLKQVTEASATPIERYQTQVENLALAFVNAGKFAGREHRFALQEIKKEYLELTGATARLTRMEKLRQTQMLRGAAVTRSLETAEEKYVRQVQGTIAAYKRGNISLETHRRKLIQLKMEYQKATVAAGTFGSGVGLAMSRIVSRTASVVGAGLLIGSFGTALRSAIRGQAEFATKMARSTAIMVDLTENQLERMRKAARDTSFEVEASAADLAESFFFLASAGMNAEQSIAALPRVAAFAQAGHFDLATATSISTDALSALGLKVDDTAQNLKNLTLLTDQLVKANSLADANTQQFSEALASAGGRMKILGVEAETGLAVLAAFAEQATKGEEAGTALDIVLRDLASKGFKNREAFRDFGVPIFDAGKFRDPIAIIGELEERFKGMSDEAVIAQLKVLGFVDKSNKNLLKLIGNAEAMREWREEIRNAGGEVDRVAAGSMTELTVALNAVRSSWDELADLAIPAFLEGFESDDLSDDLRQIARDFEHLLPLIKTAGQATAFAADQFHVLSTSLPRFSAKGSVGAEILGDFTDEYTRLSSTFDRVEQFADVAPTLMGILNPLFAPKKIDIQGVEETEAQVAALGKAAALTAEEAAKAEAELARLNGLQQAPTLEEEASAKQLKSIEKVNAAIQRKIDVMNDGEAAVRRLELAELGSADSAGQLLETYDRLNVELADLIEFETNLEALRIDAEKSEKARLKPIQDLKDDLSDYTAELEKNIATTGMSADEAKRWGFAQRIAATEGAAFLSTELQKIAALQDEAAALEDLKNVAETTFDTMTVGSQESLEALHRNTASQLEQAGDFSGGFANAKPFDFSPPTGQSLFGDIDFAIPQSVIAVTPKEDTDLLKKNNNKLGMIERNTRQQVVLEEVHV